MEKKKKTVLFTDGLCINIFLEKCIYIVCLTSKTG